MKGSLRLSISLFIMMSGASGLAKAAGSASHGAGFDFAIGANPTFFYYAETLPAPQKSTETAGFSGILGQVRARYSDETFMSLKYDYAPNVNSRYDGTSLSGNSAIATTNPLSFRTWEADFYLGLFDRFSVFVGYGGRYWNRFLSSGTGYREIYEWNFMPVGVLAVVYRDGGFSIGIEPSYRSVSNAKIKVITSETFANGADTEMILGPKPGYKLAVPMRWNMERLFLVGTPWYEHSEIGESNVAPNATLAPGAGEAIQEPASKTEQLGFEALLGYSF